MKETRALICRNTKLFFKDKGMFFPTLITPVILLVLYATFLAKVYHDSFASALPKGFEISDKLLDATVGGELISSLLAVCCVTVAFCSNLLMINDKITGAVHDLTVSPVRRSSLSIGYFASAAFSTLIIAAVAVVAGFIYLGAVGWYLSVSDVLLLIVDVFLLTLFGTALSSCINFFLSTQGQSSAVGTLVSAGYGFICGAYMPISNFSEGLQKVLSFLPGTYGTSLLRNHALNGVFKEMGNAGFPNDVVEMIRDSVDCNLYFFGNKVSLSAMYIILGGSVLLLIAIYVMLNYVFHSEKKR